MPTVLITMAIITRDGIFGPIYLGDTYLAADDRSIDFASSEWPDLTGATTVILFLPGSSPLQSFAMTFVTRAASGMQVVRWEPSAADTAALDACTPRKSWAIEATLADGSKVRLGCPTMITSK